MRPSLIVIAAVLGGLCSACDRSGGGTTAVTGGTTAAGSEAAAPGDGASDGPRDDLAGAGAAPAAPPPPPTAITPAAPAAEGDIDWSAVAPALDRDARMAIYGIIRLMDLKRYEDTGSDILSFEPGAGPTDRLANVYSPVTVMSDTFEVTPSHWLAIFNTVESWRADRGEDFMARPMPDARYGDGETSERGDLIFTFIVEDRAEKTLKVVWGRH